MVINNNEKKKNIRIAIAMSGGVDSSVAAALLVEEYGKENVFGVTMKLFCYGGKEVSPKNCCSLDAIDDAKAVCKKLGINHYTLSFEKDFKKEVIDNFVSEYLKGRTPNPCVRCNSIIKFDYLLAKVLNLGGEFLATGHYARIEKPAVNSKQSTGYKLLKGKDEKKDQSYFLYGLTQGELKHTLLPLGDYTKDKVRNLARKFELKIAEKAESQEICFIDKNYRRYLATQINTNTDKNHESIRIEEGDIVDKENKILGRHKGLPFYTIGQRRGIGISRKEPYYVIGFDLKNNRLIVGEEKDLYKKEFEVGDLNWISDGGLVKEFKADVMIRYNMKPQKAKIIIGKYSSSKTRCSKNGFLNSSHKGSNKKVKIIFDKPQKAITPGQSAVFYLKDEVLGGGVIDKI